ncbi:receptor-type guanylate cyclase gcy-3 [Galendromus occidentalis]|uniref:Receptor-type guanylate cyclase gcy-3 n=1 Tax=Galendromus occidentalis TaxID=34638 RepID=A0AAJ7L423_9ACAR|nr:receptor-type guanylate cyclase gcy-3 [Galendromus occidentalis]
MKFRARSFCAVLLAAGCISVSYGAEDARETLCSTEAQLVGGNELHINDEPVNITIGVGPRPTDQILAYILLLFIHDYIGYRVDIVQHELTSEEWVEKMNCDVEKQNCTGIPMINIGIVETTAQFPLYRDKVKSAGYLGVNIRLGWFVSTGEVDKPVFGPKPDHYRYFKDANLTERFALNPSLLDGITRRGKGEDRWCQGPRFKECKKGQYIPDQCVGNEKCAVLVAAYPHENYDIITKQIKELNLYVKVAWLGNNFENHIKRQEDKKPVLFFDYSTSPMTLFPDTYTEVLFPSCSTLSQEVGCTYQNAKLRKLYWSSLEAGAPQIVKLINNAYIRTEEFRDLVGNDVAKLHNKELQQQFACSFIKTQLDLRWSKGVDAFPKIAIHAIFPKENSSLIGVTGDAINRINKYHLKGVILVQNVVNGECNRDLIFKQYITNITTSPNQIVGVIGPDCNRSLEGLIGVAAHYRHLVFSYMMDSVIDETSRTLDNFFRIPPDTSMLAKAYVRLIKHQKWLNFAAFTDSYQSSGYIRDLRSFAQKDQRTFVGSYTYLTSGSLEESLGSMKEEPRAKIIIGDFPEKVARDVMCKAFRLKMTAEYGYVWLLPFWMKENSFKYVRGLPCSRAELRRAVDHSLVYKFRELADDDFVTTYGDNVSDWREFVTRDVKDLDDNAGFAYDSVWSLGTALGELVRHEKTFLEKLRSVDQVTSSRALRRFTEKIKSSQFRGVTGVVKFDGTHRQPDDIILYQYLNGSMERIGAFRLKRSEKEMNETEDSSLELKTAIKWYNGVKPTDGTPPCAFQALMDALGVSCDAAHIMAISGIIVGTLVLFGGVSAAFAYRHYENKMKVLEQNRNSPFIMLNDKELPENSVRIYRLVDEGAFGKVYFGDYTDENNKVTKVAVKAAKDPRNVNAKLELLTEAVIMKRFDHVNILRLVGVINKPDKCQIVTELMMYGNLKNYLQDRRHLAETGEIGALHLTRMALDICRGLSYLASLQHVHGDLACRNCLVHESLTIKIADFGFCKNLVDQGYYRIVRPGPMPVRWMSPELLRTGVYFEESDIWSFGICIFEIITFGGYPYHDRDDQNVQEFIRGGGFPTLPSKISSELEALLMRVWAIQKEERPAAIELYEILTSNPELIHPCIEEGAMMNAESLEKFSRSSQGSSTWTSRNKVRRPDSFYVSGGQRVSSMKMV